MVRFRARGDAENSTAGLRAKGNLRGKRRDPLDRANAPPKAVADLVQKAEGRNASTQACLGPVHAARYSASTVAVGQKASLNNPALARGGTALL